MVLKTRNRSYSDITKEIDTLNPDYILEIHLNAANMKAQGSEILYCRASARGKKMAEIIQNNLVKNLNLTDRRAKAKEKKRMEATYSGTLNRTNELHRQEVYEALRASIREIVDKGV